jgi:RNA polymerase sigma-70 factor (family 1)
VLETLNHTQNWAGTVNEDDVLQLVAKGDQRAFAWMVAKYSDTVYCHCLAYTKSVEKTEELAQDIFLKVWASRERLGEIESFKDWLFVLTRNRCYRMFRLKVQETVQLTEGLVDGEVVSGLTPDLTVEAREAHQLLLKGVELLPEKRRQVFRMNRLEGMSHKEIAEALNIHKDTVNQQLVKALSFLKKYMESHGTDTIVLIILLRGMID